MPSFTLMLSKALLKLNRPFLQSNDVPFSGNDHLVECFRHDELKKAWK